MDKIRVLLAENYSIVREGTAEFIQREPDMEVVGEVSDVEEAVKLASESQPNVVVMDMPMPKLNGIEATGSMGDDTPLAVLSRRPELLFSYFKQLFAQVTNPPIDPIREEMVMDEAVMLGGELNLLDETPEHCKRLRIPRPIVTNDELERIRYVDRPGLRAKTLSIVFEKNKIDPEDERGGSDRTPCAALWTVRSSA